MPFLFLIVSRASASFNRVHATPRARRRLVAVSAMAGGYRFGSFRAQHGQFERVEQAEL
jgi:hypothetical protein